MAAPDPLTDGPSALPAGGAMSDGSQPVEAPSWMVRDAVLQRLLVRGGVDETVEGIIAAALDAVPHVAWVGVSLGGRDGGLCSRGSSDPVAAALDTVQGNVGEGPSWDAARGSWMVVADDLAARGVTRWPRFALIARDHGVTAACALRLVPGANDTVGVLTLYGDRPGAFDSTSRHTASLVASHAAVALHGARRVDQLDRALRSRDVIGQAKGILMQRRGLSEDQAWRELERASQDTNIKLRDVAAWLVDDVGTANADSEAG